VKTDKQRYNQVQNHVGCHVEQRIAINAKPLDEKRNVSGAAL